MLPSPATRTAGLAGVLAAGALVLTGCSDPAVSDVPSPSAGLATPGAPTPATATPTPSSPTPSSPTSSPAPTSSPTPTPTRSTAAAEPSGGNQRRVLPSRPVRTTAPTRLDEPARTAGATVSLQSVRSTTVRASDPADRSGPGVLVRLTLENTTGRTLDTSFLGVQVTGAGGAPGAAVGGPPTDPLPSSVRAGATARGAYAFLVADAKEGPLTVAVTVTAGEPVVQFRGRAS